MNFDFTPDPKVLLALTHTPMQPLDALCELIDNAIDSFYAAELQGVNQSNRIVTIHLPSMNEISADSGILRVQDNGPGMTAEVAERSIRAGFSGNNSYDTLGLFGMGFNISTGKLGNKTTLMTARKDSDYYIKTEINLSKISQTQNYSLEAFQILKGKGEPFSEPNSHGTIVEVSDWWPEGNANSGFVKKLVHYGKPKVREEIGRRYATILRDEKKGIEIDIDNIKCEAFSHCVWDRSRYVVRKNGNVPAVFDFDKVLDNTRRCVNCTAILKSDETACPLCGSTNIRTIEERVTGWVGIQRYDSETDFGIDLIRNGRAIKIGEKSAFFEYVDDLKHIIKDYPIDSQYGRIVGEVHMDFVPVDFLKQDFQRSSEEWQKAMSFLRGDSSLQPNQKNADKNTSYIFKLFQAYRKVRNFGRQDMYMGYWDPVSNSPKRISREKEKEYLERFKNREPGYFDDSEWWKLVETADQPPVDKLPECPICHAQNLESDEVCQCCGHILKGKECINPDCKQQIQFSAVTCPHCGTNQFPTIIEPWTCEICGHRNIATDNYCKICNNERGIKNPLSIDELYKNSEKVDSLSNESLTVPLSDGSKDSINLQVYSSNKPLSNPLNKRRIPLYLEKDANRIIIFIDFSHPYFSKCGLPAEQIVASEVALYYYQTRSDLNNRKDHKLSIITWDIMQENWNDVVEINSEHVLKESEELLSDIRSRLANNLGDKAAQYYGILTDSQKLELTTSMINMGIGLEKTGELIASGDYLNYVPFDFVYSLFQEDSEIFFGGNVWTDNLVSGGEAFLGDENVAKIKGKLIKQYENYLHDIILLCENKYADTLVLKRVRLSIEFLRRNLVS